MDISTLNISDLNFSQWALQTIAMMLTAFLIPKLNVDGPIPAFLTVLALAFFNAHVWSTALFFEIPDSVSVQALTLLLSNSIIFWIIVKILPGIECEGFLPAIVAPVVFTGTMLLISRYGDSIEWGVIAKATLDFVLEVKSFVQGVSEKPATETSSLLLPHSPFLSIQRLLVR